MTERSDDKSLEPKIWEELLEKFDDEERHKKYLRFCLENNLVGQAIRRYSEYSEDKGNYPVELRRIAYSKYQQLMGIMVMETRTKAASPKKMFRTLSTIDFLSLALVLILFFGGIFVGSWLMGILSILAFGGYMVYKFTQAMKKLDRGEGGGL